MASLFSADERLVAYSSDEGGRADIWVRPLAGGDATQITHVSGFVHSFAFSPTDDWLIYESDIGGDALPHLFLTDAKGAASKDIAADYPKGRRTEFVRWREDGKAFLYQSNLRDETLMDLYEYDLAKGKSARLWEASGKLSLELASRDATRFILKETVSDADSNLYLLERGKPKTVLLTKHDGEVLYGATSFTKDKRAALVVSDEGGEFSRLFELDLATLKKRPVLEEQGDVEDGGFSRTWKYSYTSTNIDGTAKLVVSDVKTKSAVPLPPAPSNGVWSLLGFSHSDRYVAAALRTDAAPQAAYVIDLERQTATLVRDVVPDSLRAVAMVGGESVRIPSFDQKNVPAFLYKPAGGGPFPAVIDVHGGPTSQSRRDFNRMRQYLVSKGYVVLVPNVRGSTGYGKTWTKLDNLDLGGGPLKDVVACKNWLAAKANVDANKVVVMGGSYGGYMALAAEAFAPTEFAANVDYFGVSDLKSLVESFPPYWASFATYIYKKFGDPKNPDDARYQHDCSPLNFVDQMQRPLLVVQGEKDARVKKDQSDRLVAALSQRNVPVHYLVLADEGHGFSKNENYLLAYKMTDRFLDRYVFGDTSIELPPAVQKK